MKRKLSVRAAASAAAVLAALTMSGCSLSALTAENVMEPPQPFGDSAAIQTALEEVLGPQITLCYPRSGEHRSAVVRADVDGDRLEEAIVFYRGATEKTGAHMALLDLNDREKWTLTTEFTDAEGEIDRVIFADLDADGAQDIITGWSVHSDYGRFYAHSCSGGQLNELTVLSGSPGAQSYSSYIEMAAGNFDGDPGDELITLCVTEGSGEARLLKWHSSSLAGRHGSIRPVSSVTLRSGVKSYISCTAGYLNWSSYGLVADSQRADGRYSSEVVLWDKESQTLISPAFEGESDPFLRSLPTESGDVDGDGYIDIPGDSLLPDCSSSSASKVYLTDWHRYSGEGFSRSFSAVIRSDYGYYFVMPEEWTGIVTAQPDNDTRSLHFYMANSFSPFSTELMCITVFTADEWEEEISGRGSRYPEYLRLHTTDYYVYAVRIFQPPAPIIVTYDTVADSFVSVL